MKINHERIDSIVKAWFSAQAKNEWKRLQRDPYHQIEFLLTTYFLKKHLPEKGFVLDAGGGPGRYTIELAKWGYDMVLLDLVPDMLRIAKREIRRAGVQGTIKQIVQGSIEDLSAFESESFDAVMCLGGPLGHLLKPKQREKAASELMRVAKRGAPIFTSVISRIGPLRTILTRFPHEMKYAKHHWEAGDYVPGLQGEGFTAAHWFLPEELKELFERAGAEVLETAGLEGLSSHQEKATNSLHRDQERWKMWMEIVLRTCTHPSVVGSTEHFLLVCRKST